MEDVREIKGGSKLLEEGAARHGSGGLLGPSRRPDRRGKTLSSTTDLRFFFRIGDEGGDDTRRLCDRGAEMDGGSGSRTRGRGRVLAVPFAADILTPASSMGGSTAFCFPFAFDDRTVDVCGGTRRTSVFVEALLIGDDSFRSRTRCVCARRVARDGPAAAAARSRRSYFALY